jgi:hypothetical protein
MQFGATDSVKSFSLSSGELLLLTKHHGFQNFPDLGGTELFDLTGIEGRDLGEKVPGFQEFYDFEVGDVFMLKNSFATLGPVYTNEEYLRIEILDKQILDDTIKFQVNANQLQITAYGFGADFFYVSSDTIIQNLLWEVVDQPFFTKTYPNELLKINDQVPGIAVLCMAPNYHVQLGLDSLGILTKSIADFNTPYQPTSLGYDMEGELLVPRDGNGDYCFLGMAYKTGLGKTFYSSGYFESEENYQLLGYVKGQDTVGVIYSDEELLVNATKEQGQAIQVGLSPNPAQGQVLLTASFPSFVTSATLTLFDALGRPLLQKNLQPNGNTLQEWLNTDGMPSGVYLVHLAVEGGTWSGKLMVK